MERFLRCEREKNAPKAQAAHGREAARAVFFHPDYTVGSGIRPDLLTFRSFENPLPGSARGLARSPGEFAPTAGGESHPALKTFYELC